MGDNKKPLLNSQPLNSSYTKEELVALEHEWRLKLKKSGFSDIEMWDNKPHKKKKKIFFIKGHIRWNQYDNNLKTFSSKSDSVENYYRTLSIYAYHCKSILPKYQEILQEYSYTGNLKEAIKKINPEIRQRSIYEYLRKHKAKMVDFVREYLKQEDLEDLIETIDFQGQYAA